ncbi:DEAD/DEAH box helicase [Ligilactobacillus salivarius]|uniref:SNF2-related protein n=1 Tax=Ligilactobacillus salivarius TaxID=1624 RepID=UPI001F4F5FDF|nr:DEAD/DEAH box helicase [Ligilactobacillus salivarius]
MPKIKLFKHQEDILEETKDMNKVAYYLDMGLGKTFVGSEKLHQLNKRANLLICQKSLIPMWINHFKTYYKYQVFDGTKSTQLNQVLNSYEKLRPFVLIINYDLVFRRDLKSVFRHDFTLMLDESSMIQNEKTKRAKYILKMHPDNIILLSGTPTSGKYERLWSQAHLLGWNITKSKYNKIYVNWDTMYLGIQKFKVVNKDHPYKNVQRLKRKLREHGAVFMKTEDVFELPEQNFIPIKVKQSSNYRKFLKDKYLEFDSQELLGDTALTYLLGLRQLSGMYSKEKLDRLSDLIDSTEDRLIIFYNFERELDEIVKIAKNKIRPISIVNGKTKNLTNYETKDDSITLIQYQAGSMGLNLQKANKIIYFTPPQQSELYEQSKKRIHRIGQERSCFYYNLIVEKSVEERIYRALKERRDYTDELFKSDFD